MDSNLPSDAPIPRLCHLIKWPDFDGYGFNLQLGQYIGKVDNESPAQYADLREGDRIIEVNGVPISNENHKQVVQRIKQIANETRLLVIDQNEYNWYKERDLVIKSTQSNIKHCKTPVPRPSATVNNNYYYYNHDDEEEQQQQQISTANTSLSSNNETISTKSVTNNDNKNEIIKDDSLTNEVLNELEKKENEIKLNENEKVNEIAIKLESTRLEKNDTSSTTIESNNNSEKEANQNLVSPIKNTTPAKTHNFIVVNSEEQFEAEKRLKKEEQMKNNTTTPIKNELNHNYLRINNKSTSNLSSSNHNQSNSLSSDIDINLNMSVSEMRKIIASRKNVKQECKKPTINLRQKYEIIQQM